MSSAERLIDLSLRDASIPTLLIADENIDLEQIHQQPDRLLTNRFDQHQHAIQKGWRSEFSDYKWPDALEGPISVIYRISKEKAVVKHLLNCAQLSLQKGSQLTLIGHKGEGFKSISKLARNALNGECQERKVAGDLWMAQIIVGDREKPEDDDYFRIRPVAELDQHTLYAKPGMFGWQKLDPGSTLLLEQLPDIIGLPLPLGNISLLDLGCGSGYLALASAGADTRVVATDNNAAAIECCQYNLQQAELKASVLPTNAGTELEDRFDLILCNPPFHSGFRVDHGLTDKFSKQAARLLKPNGKAVFVVNQHVPLGTIARRYFYQVELHTDNGSFCVYSLTQPRI